MTPFGTHARALVSALAIVAVSAVGLVAAPAATAAETRTISGVVTLPGGPDPVVLDAVKVFYKPEGGASSTEANVTSTGAFSITGLAPGRYEVCASPRGYTKDGVYYKGPYNVINACFNTVDVLGTRGTVDVTNADLVGQTLALPWGLTISGTVSLPAGADPEWLRGIEAYSQRMVTGGWVGNDAMVDPNTGAYHLHSLYPGEHSVLFRAKTYTDPATGASVTPALGTGAFPTKVVLTTDSVADINAAMPASSITGKFSVVGRPEVVGDPVVGETLTVNTGTWFPAATSFTYEWVRGGQIVEGATGPSYSVTADDLNSSLHVRVSGAASGISPTRADSGYVYVANTFTSLGTPTISGAAQVGATLTCAPGTWVPDPTEILYKWSRGGTYIVGATSATYVTQPADAGTQVRCHVTADRGPYPAITRNSAPLLLLQTFTSPGSVVISGEANLDSTLTASVSGTSPASSTVAYQWFRNDVPIPSATTASYTVKAGDSLTTLRVTAQVARSGFITASATAAQVSVPKLFSSAPAVTIAGAVGLGEVLTATTSAWSPVATFAFQWLRNGSPIAGAQARTYTLTADDQNATITLRVVGSAPTYTSATRTASITTLFFFERGSAPTISGEYASSGQLRASKGTSSPEPTHTTYQWRRNGEVVGSNSWVYWLTEEDFGTSITLTTIGTKSTYSPLHSTSTPHAVPLGTLSPVVANAVPSIDGTAAVGSPVTTAPVDVAPAATGHTYQWLRNGSAIAGATAETYTPTAADLGTALTVRVTSTRKGYEPLALVSEPSTVAPGTFTAVATPGISGTAAAGSTLTTTPGAWSPTATFAYQWYRGGNAISGATASTYKLTTADADTTITVKVTGSRAGYASVAKVSSGTLVAKAFTTVTPKITGTLKSGYTLTAIRGTWSPTATYSYQWYRSGTAIKGATAKTYKLTTTDRGKTITVKVTGKRTGYATTTKTSAGKYVPKVFTKTVTPTITGTLRSGKTLTALRGTWSPTATYSYQWYRSGVKIPGATSKSYKLTTKDKGKKIQVKVTGKRTGYTTVTKSSASKTAAR